MISKNARKVISMVLVLFMFSSSMVFGQGADYQGHWAASSIKSWVDKGYVKGYADGSFKPENDITRAEFISIVNRAFGFTEEVEVSYTDVQESHWAYDEFKRAGAAGYIDGFEDGTLRPNSQITRQEVAAIVSTLLGLSEAKTSEKFLELTDVLEIPEWSAGSVSAVVDKGYMNLRDDNSFDGATAATRAEVISALDGGYLNFTKVKYDKAGTYTAGLVDGSVEITVKDVVLEDTTINGDLVISEGVESGDVTLKNVIVKGDTIVNGGGMDTITVEDSKIANLIVNKKNGKVRILAVGTTDVAKTELQSGAKLESKDKKVSNFGNVVVAEKLTSDEPVILDGNFANVEVKSGSNAIKVLGGTIKNLVIAKTAKDVKINLAEGVKVEKLEVNAPATVDGKGQIDKAVVNVDGVVIAAPTTTMEKADGVEVETELPSTGGGGGGSDDSDSGSDNVTRIKVEKVGFTTEGAIDVLAVTLSEVPKTRPTALSVKVTRTIDGKNDDSFEWRGGTSTWSVEDRVLTIFDTIKSVKATEVDQVVSYTVSYGNTAGVKSNEITVEKADLVDPEKPVDPEVPVDPEKPGDDIPLEPSTPVDPEKPVDPEEPEVPEGKGDGLKTVVTTKGAIEITTGASLTFTVTTESAIFVESLVEGAGEKITLVGENLGFEVKIENVKVTAVDAGQEMTFVAKFTEVTSEADKVTVQFEIAEDLFSEGYKGETKTQTFEIPLKRTEEGK